MKRIQYGPVIPGFLLILFVFFFLGPPSLAGTKAYPTSQSMNGLVTKFPQQLERAVYEKLLGEKIGFMENPLFNEKVTQGILPPVQDRLPAEPLVVIPEKVIGKYGGTLRGIALSYESGTSEILSWRQANLVRFSKDNRTIVPNVAKSWKWNQDRSKITFYLRKGHRWSDGAPFTAEDIRFYLNDIILNKEIHPETPAPWKDFNPIVHKLNETTVQFVFNKPFTSLLFYLGGTGSYYDSFAPGHFLKQFHIKYNPDADKQAKARGFDNWVALFRNYWNRWKDAVVNKASGLDVPTLESHILKEAPNPEQRIFVANPYYFKIDTAGNQLPYINYHLERFLEKKEWVKEIIGAGVDQKSQNMPLESYPLLKENQAKGDFYLQMPISGFGPAIHFNKTHKDQVLKKIYATPEFNWAASLAINRKQINKRLFLNLCKIQQAIPINIPFATDADRNFMVRYDPARANKYLDGLGLKRGSDGYRLRPDGKPFVINWEYTLQFVWSHELPRLIAGYWDDLGIRVNLKEVTTKVSRAKQIANDLDISNSHFNPFEHTLFASPTTFMPPYGTAYPTTGITWWQWKNSKGQKGEEPPVWVKNLWELGDEFITLVPGSDWYNAIGKEIVRINLENLSVISTLAQVPQITVISNKLENVPKWKNNAYSYGYAYPYRADQWSFK